MSSSSHLTCAPDVGRDFKIGHVGRCKYPSLVGKDLFSPRHPFRDIGQVEDEESRFWYVRCVMMIVNLNIRLFQHSLQSEGPGPSRERVMLANTGAYELQVL